MRYVPISIILSTRSCLPQWSTILNLSHETTDLTHCVSAVLSLKLIFCSLLSCVSVLRVIILKLLVKPAVYNCILAHSTSWSEITETSEDMAMNRKSQENHKTQDSGDSCCDEYSSFLMRKLFLPLFSIVLSLLYRVSVMSFCAMGIKLILIILYVVLGLIFKSSAVFTSWLWTVYNI